MLKLANDRPFEPGEIARSIDGYCRIEDRSTATHGTGTIRGTFDRRPAKNRLAVAIRFFSFACTFDKLPDKFRPPEYSTQQDDLTCLFFSPLPSAAADTFTRGRCLSLRYANARPRDCSKIYRYSRAYTGTLLELRDKLETIL